ncbi:MAG: hypothetical protein A3G66_02095 [Candidatus Levybacteria bacterium RIFCSPLOWO2_12_FULL_39_17]|nr:MAG: hypothetical protein A3G66_02095 [Candidatus Levybacteria bacterium RIFCSPLOWO2_12_FULL_39_17]
MAFKNKVLLGFISYQEKVSMNLKLDTVLAYALIIPYILSVGLAPKSTPFWLFTLIFIGLISYLVLDLSKLKQVFYERAKNILLWALLIVIIGSSFFSTIFTRYTTFPTYQVHDIIIQQEAAIRFLLIGKNPYSEHYLETPLAKWRYSDNPNEKNPALWHFVMEPFYLLFSLPFYFISGRLFGYFDGRFPLIFLFFTTLFFAYKLIAEGEKKRSFLLLLAFNPSMIYYTLEGRSDYFMFGFLFAGFYFLFKEKLFLSAVLMAFAFAVKQSAWPLFPFYFAYLFFKHKNKIFKTLSLFSFTFASVVLPFVLWNPKAFYKSTILYLSGNTEFSYPISGYGFGMLLNQFGIIKDIHDKTFPFFIFQLVVGLPLLWFLIKYLKKNLSVKILVIVYGIFLFVYWYFSRYFNNNHIAFLSLLFTSAYFWPQKNEVVNK